MLLELRGLTKRFTSTVALDELELRANSGEILGVVGPNGAGKSTMIRILAGELAPDSGEILIDGREWSRTNRRHDIVVVHQEPELFPTLTVAQNLLIGREGGQLGRPHIGAQEKKVLSDLQIVPYQHRTLDSCSLVVRQLTEIARALVHDAQVFLFDEPNSALTREESARLFRYIHALKDAGHVVLLVSHRIAEVVEHADRVAVIRQGRCTALLRGDDLTEEALAQQLVVGEREQESIGRGRGTDSAGAPLLRVEGWTHARRAFADVTFQAVAGEIVALVGVEGSGARELLRSLAGLVAAHGTIEISGLTGRAASRALVAYIPADRKVSLFTNLSVGENLVARLGAPEIAGRWGNLRKRRLSRLARELVRRFQIHVRAVDQPIRTLSGGNQQKVALAGAMAKRPRVLALEEPTRGVDIGTKAEIYHLLREYVRDGNAVVAYCTEVSEVFELADKVVVVSEGHLADYLDVTSFTRVEALAAEITGLESSLRAVAVGRTGSGRPDASVAEGMEKG
jgi:ABC-type sugar transport system ATPase subunit